MNEKRYFCDYWFGVGRPAKVFNAIMILFMTISIFVGTAISYSIMSSKHGYALEGYSESAYQHLDEIANNVISEGQGFNLLAIPNDVASYEIVSENDVITFNYTLDNNKGSQFSYPASMTIELSESFEIISKKPNFSSEREYVKHIKIEMIIISFLYGGLSFVVIGLGGMIGCTIAAFVSQANKNKDKTLNK